MKKTRLLSLILALIMIATLAACGGQSDSQSDDTSTTVGDETSVTESADETEVIEEDDAAENDDLPEFTLKMAATANESELGGQIMEAFIAYVTEHTNGKVTFETYYGGVLASSSEELALVSSGSVDLIPLGHNAYSDVLPLLNGPSWVNGTEEDALDYFNYIVFENEETSALIQAEAAEQNVIFLGFQPGGVNVFVSKAEAYSFADLKGKQIGAMANQALFESMGLVVVTTAPGDIYESLSRGVIDVGRLGFTAAVNNKWYEVAKYWLMDGTAAAGSPFTMNLDTWNSLPAEYQEIFYEAAEYAAEYGLELSNDSYESNVAMLEEEGCTVIDLSTEDQENFYNTLIEVTLETCRERAERLDIVEEEEVVLGVILEYLGLEG